jgi:hypothetical protein
VSAGIRFLARERIFVLMIAVFWDAMPCILIVGTEILKEEGSFFALWPILESFKPSVLGEMLY